MATSLTDLLKYLSAILLIEIVTVLLVLLAPEDLRGFGWLRLIVPLLVVAIVAALWLNTLAAHQRREHLARADRKFAREREKIRVNAERAKSRVIKQAHKDIARETRSAHARANFKVGAAFAAAFGAGAVMLLTQFMTLGVVTLTAAGGALGGYLYRARRENASMAAMKTLPPGKAIAAERLKIEGSNEHAYRESRR